MVHGLETSKARSSEDSTTPSAKAVGHTADPELVGTNRTYFYERHKGDCPQCANPNTTQRGTYSDNQPELWCSDCRLSFPINHALISAARRLHPPVIRTDRRDNSASLLPYQDVCNSAIQFYSDRSLAEFNILEGAELQTPYGYYRLATLSDIVPDEDQPTQPESQTPNAQEKLRNSHYQLLSALKAILASVAHSDYDDARLVDTAAIEHAKSVLAQAEEGL